MKEWYTAEELAGIPGMPATAAEVRAIAEFMGWESRPVRKPHQRKAALARPWHPPMEPRQVH